MKNMATSTPKELLAVLQMLEAEASIMIGSSLSEHSGEMVGENKVRFRMKKESTAAEVSGGGGRDNWSPRTHFL